MENGTPNDRGGWAKRTAISASRDTSGNLPANYNPGRPDRCRAAEPFLPQSPCFLPPSMGLPRRELPELINRGTEGRVL